MLPRTTRRPLPAEDLLRDTRGAATHPRTYIIGGILGLLTCIGLSMLGERVNEEAQAGAAELDMPAPLPTLSARK